MIEAASGGCLTRARILMLGLVSTLALAAPASAQSQPNVLVVMSDDQPYGSVSKMPWLSSRPDFTTFTRAFDNNPLCCPARATFLSGLYSHHTGVEFNTGRVFDPTDTVARTFDESGYETGLFGKYLNTYPFRKTTAYIPPNWDRWVAFAGDRASSAYYYDYALSVDGERQRIGNAPSDYSTDVLADHVNQFIRGADEPFFAVYTPYGPHSPYIAAPRHKHAYDDERVPLPPNFNKVDDQIHRFYRVLSPRSRDEVRRVARRQYETLLSEDEAMERFFTTLREQGELDRTIVLFLTDNGYSLGAHRWLEKQCLFEECGRLELRLRVPWLDTGGKQHALVSNVDLRATLTDLAGLEVPQTDGTSLTPLLAKEATTLDRPVLLRSVRNNGNRPRPEPPTGWGLRTERWKYIRYANGEVDMFDLLNDPNERQDLGNSKAHARRRAALAAELKRMR